MVQQVIDKFNEYSSIHSGSAMPAGDKKHPVLVKKVALRELPNTSDNIMSKPAENSPLAKERGPMTDSVKTFGRKRQNPDSLSSPSSQQPHVHKRVHEHLVYVRRRHETERGKKNTSNNADSLSSSIFSGKPEKEVIMEPKVQQERTQECNEISHSHEEAINGLEPMDSGITAIVDAPVDPARPNDLDCKADPQISSNKDSNASVHLQRSSSQEDKTPVDPQRPSNQDLNAPVDPQRTTNLDTRAPVDPQRPSNPDLNAPVDPQRPCNQDLNAPVDPQRPSNQDDKAPVDSQRPISQDCKSPVDLWRLGNQDRKAPVEPQRPGNQESEAPLDTQRLNNRDSKAPVDTRRLNGQDSKAPLDPQRPSTQDRKERYLQLQVFLKNCDQSSQEDYRTSKIVCGLLHFDEGMKL